MNEVDVHEFSEMIKKANTFMKDLQRRIQQIKMEIEHVQNESTDISHYIEFNNLNAADGFKMYKQQQDCLKRRRKLKDELDYLEAIEKQSKHTFKHPTGLDHMVNSIDKTKTHHKTRVYTPRVRKDLFNN